MFHCVGVSGGTASGKTTVCDMIIQQLHDHRVVLVNQVYILIFINFHSHFSSFCFYFFCKGRLPSKKIIAVIMLLGKHVTELNSPVLSPIFF